jgi:type I restriction enzyme, R subunit
MRNESETRAELIDPLLTQSQWAVSEDSRILREYQINDGQIQPGGIRGKRDIADYILIYKGEKIAVVEAKSESLGVSEWVMQAKLYAHKLSIQYTYSTNGHEIYEIDMVSGTEQKIERFPTPEELWHRVHSDENNWREKFLAVPFESVSGTRGARYYQEIAVRNVMNSVAQEKNKILLTLATGTGKTFIAFQIAWKLFQSRWNLKRDGARQPRILFLADRNILADQAYNSFSAFPEDALVRISPADIKKKWSVPTNGSIFFTIFQTFMSGPRDAEGNATPYFGDYPADFFDFIIIDECHRGGAKDESSWKWILEYFSPAVQLGLTATPKRKDNVDTYAYFGEPVYAYSLKDGINDGFLTPFKVKRISTTMDDYVYTSDDEVIEGEVQEGKIYEEGDFNRTIEIEWREKKRVQIMLSEIDPSEKTIVFCANQAHAALVRDLINQLSDSTNPHYCVRVTANDGARGELFLRDFQDNEKTIPTILTTSQKLSTWVDARNVRNIVLLRPVNSMIEFKQIVGRGTRLFDGKEYFTILDFVDAYKHFSDKEWDGEPLAPAEIIGDDKRITPEKPKTDKPGDGDDDGGWEKKQKIKIKLRDGKEMEIQHMVATSFWSADGKPISTQEFLDKMFGELPEFFRDENELRKIWANPETRKAFLEKIATLGFGREQLETLQKMINAEKSDLFDVLAFFTFHKNPITRLDRVQSAERDIMSNLSDAEKEFIDFVLKRYIESGFEELNQDRLPQLLKLKYQSLADAEKSLWDAEKIRDAFFAFQEELYQK